MRVLRSSRSIALHVSVPLPVRESWFPFPRGKGLGVRFLKLHKIKKGQPDSRLPSELDSLDAAYAASAFTPLSFFTSGITSAANSRRLFSASSIGMPA